MVAYDRRDPLASGDLEPVVFIGVAGKDSCSSQWVYEYSR